MKNMDTELGFKHKSCRWVQRLKIRFSQKRDIQYNKNVERERENTLMKTKMKCNITVNLFTPKND